MNIKTTRFVTLLALLLISSLLLAPLSTISAVASTPTKSVQFIDLKELIEKESQTIKIETASGSLGKVKFTIDKQSVRIEEQITLKASFRVYQSFSGYYLIVIVALDFVSTYLESGVMEVQEAKALNVPNMADKYETMGEACGNNDYCSCVAVVVENPPSGRSYDFAQITFKLKEAGDYRVGIYTAYVVLDSNSNVVEYARSIGLALIINNGISWRRRVWQSNRRWSFRCTCNRCCTNADINGPLEQYRYALAVLLLLLGW